MTIEVPGKLEIDTSRGVVYFHSAMGRTVLRICHLNPLALRGFDPAEGGFIDLTHMRGVSITKRENLVP